MTVVVLPYRALCGFYIHLEQINQAYIHEFRPDTEMQLWLDAHGPYSYQTLNGEVGSMEVLMNLEVTLRDIDTAVLFKLTFA